MKHHRDGRTKQKRKRKIEQYRSRPIVGRCSNTEANNATPRGGDLVEGEEERENKNPSREEV
jgi:hypothetical protein